MTKHWFTRLLPAEWNRRVLTDDDFHRFCVSEGVSAFECPMQIPGAYCIYDGSPVIFINRDQPASQKLFVKFHELAHHWLHYPGVQFFLDTHTKVETEANIVAACALIPVTLLTVKSESEIIDEYGYSSELINIRSEIYRTWRI